MTPKDIAENALIGADGNRKQATVDLSAEVLHDLNRATYGSLPQWERDAINKHVFAMRLAIKLLENPHDPR